ncbi:MAG: sigma-70 family RNA polymerase sigma factor [Lachnospiraceae bacterium]|nr:sigma-70 family RNA polymerase sigma factor [Lachnospiraceae bacterium]
MGEGGEKMENGASSYHRYLEGDNRGLTELVNMYYDGLVLFLNTWLNNLHDAEDMAEETILVLTTKKPAFKGNSSFKTWLYAIGRNVTGKYIRKNHKAVSVAPEEMMRLADQEQDAAQDFFADEEKQALHRGLSRLRPEFRRALWLKYFESMSAQEISVVMNKSVHSVNHLIERGREALREEMNKEGFHERSW